MEMMKNMTKEMCTETPKCNYQDYQIKVVGKPYGTTSGIFITVLGENSHEFNVAFETVFVEKIATEPSYGIQNLIAEVGGNASLFLGICGLEILLKLTKMIAKIRFISKRTYHIFANEGMWLAFIFWSTQALLHFRDEPLSMNQIQETSSGLNNFPLLTFCPQFATSKMQDILSLHNPSALENLNFISFIQKLLTTESNLFISDPYPENDLEWLGYEIINDPFVLYNSSFDLNLMNDTYLFFDIHDLIKKVYIKGETHNLELEKNDLWSPVYHQDHGLCYTFDVKKSKLDLDSHGEGAITLHFKFKNDVHDKTCNIQLLGNGGLSS